MSKYERIYTPEMADNLVEMFADGSSVTQVCAQKLKISRQTFYQWLDQYPDFADAFKMGYEAALAAQEAFMDNAIQGNVKNYSFPAHHLKMRTQFKRDYCEKSDDNNDSGVQVLIKALKEAQDANAKKTEGDT